MDMKNKDATWNDTLSRDLYREFAGRGVILTGVGNRNIGAALADAFHWLGAKTAVLGHDEIALRTVCETLEKKNVENFPVHKPFCHAADLSIEREWKAALAKSYAAIGSPYVFVNCMANDRRIDIGEVGQTELEALYRINFIVPILMARDVIKEMRRGDGGSVSLFSSHHGAGLNDTMMLGYGPAKAALDKGIRLLADWAAGGQTGMNIIRVNGERPGWVATPAQLERFSTDVIEDATRKQRIPGVMGPYDIVPQIISHIARVTGGWSSGTIYDTDAGRADDALRQGSV
jgi:NAD(P)-dependent dehydrogenase (short-subunit alcohol dehydrogenase family)